MKKLIILLWILSICACLQAQFNSNAPWTFMNGEKRLPMRPHYGVRNAASNLNLPGGRKDAYSWKAADGSIWVFGGYGFAGNHEGYLNDIWKYNPNTNQWAWINGDQLIDQPANYGTKGTASSTNKPGARGSGITWIGNDGKFYLFGGVGYTESDFGRLNDLWSYDPATDMWTWVEGNPGVNSTGIYGSQGVSNSTNWPGSRSGSTMWNASGVIYLFGGSGFATSNDLGNLNDLWKLDQSSLEWTWISGEDAIDVPTSASGPGARTSGQSCWIDDAGDLFLFGGLSEYVPSGPKSTNPSGIYLNELWKYETGSNTWTLMKGGSLTGTSASYGIKGSMDPGNQPGPRAFSIAWNDDQGNFWLYGGRGWNTNYFTFLNDLWKYDPSLNQWAWMKGDNSGDHFYGTFNTQGVASVNNIPDSRAGGIAWTNAAGKLCFFGGYIFSGATFSMHNDIWQYDPSSNMHTWMKGDSSITVKPVFGTMGTPAPDNRPGERRGGATWTDNAGNLWLFGGDIRNSQSGPPAKAMNDLWKYNILSGEWTWMKGGPGFDNPVHGTIGVPDDANRPGQRENAKTWKDASGNFWMFGGFGFLGNWNDMWKYDPSTNRWTWMKGSSSPDYFFNTDVSYGLQGVPAATNRPGRRQAGANWTDAAGNFWIFGGSGRNAEFISDLWRFNPSTNEWTWMHGDTIPGQYGIYGTQGVGDPLNNPGVRDGSASWTDSDGNLWLFGGEIFDPFGGPAGYYNDLWKFDISNNEWTWIGGDQTFGNPGIYGVKGTPDPSNKPGSRSWPSTWIDASGNFWMMGGRGFDANGVFGELNDMWTYNPSTNEWTWVKGDTESWVNGVYSAYGVPALSNKPGGRYGASTWKDGAGDVWIYGGMGLAETGRDRLSDLWRISSSALAPLPVSLLEFSGRLMNEDGVLDWITENELNAESFTVERSTDGANFIAIGTVSASNTSGRHNYQYRDENVAQLGAAVIYYRLKQIDIDGRSVYSRVIALTIDRAMIVQVYPNPVTSVGNISITSDRAGVVNAKLFSPNGTLAKQIRWNITEGNNTMQVEMNNLSAGVYILQIEGPGLFKSISLIKGH